MKSKRRTTALLATLGLVCVLALTGCGQANLAWSNVVCWDGGTHNYSWFIQNPDDDENLTIVDTWLSPSPDPDAAPLSWPEIDLDEGGPLGPGEVPPGWSIGSWTNNLEPAQTLLVETRLGNSPTTDYDYITLTAPTNCGTSASIEQPSRPTEVDGNPIAWVE